MKFIAKMLCIIIIYNILLQGILAIKSLKNHRRLRHEKKYLVNKFKHQLSKLRHRLSRAPTTTLTTTASGTPITIMLKRVLVDIDIIVLDDSIGSNGSHICQIDYELVDEKTSTSSTIVPTDLNRGAGGKYLYMCAKYRTYADMTSEEKPINTLTLQVGNSNCGDLKGGDLDLNKGAGGEYIYLCRGNKEYDDKNLNAPIKKLMTWFYSSPINNLAFSKNGDKYECLTTDVNKGAGGSYIYLCFTREYGAPKKIEYTDLVIDESQKTLVGEASTFTLDEFVMDNGDGGSDLTVTLDRSEQKGKTKSDTTTNSGGFGLSVSYTSYVGMLGVTLGKFGGGVETTFNWSGSNTSATTNLEANSETMTCTAPAGRYFKCQKTKNTSKYNYPYSFNKRYYDYNGNVFTETTTGTQSNVVSSEVVANSCCYNMCEKDDIKCDQFAKIGNTTPCENNLPVKQTINTTKSQFKLSDIGLDIEVLVDIKIVIGDNTSCPNGYTRGTLDIRASDGGDDIFLCTKKLKLSAITTGMNTINEVRVQYGNNKCGVLANLVKTFDDPPMDDITNGYKHYVCFGNNPASKSFAITDIELQLSNSTKPSNSGDITYDIIPEGISSTRKYFKVKRHKKVPRKVSIKNYKILNFERTNISLPTNIDVIIAKGSSVTKKISNTVSTENTKTSSFEFGVAVSFELTVGSEDLGFELTGGFKANYNHSSESTTTDTSETSDSQEIVCNALPKKEIKCIITKSTARVIQNYSYDQEYEAYDGTIIAKQTFTGTSETKESKSLSISTCCLNGCCTGDKDKDAGKSQCFDDNKDVRPKDLTCAEYDQCLVSTKSKFAELKPSKTVSLSTTASKVTFFR